MRSLVYIHLPQRRADAPPQRCRERFDSSLHVYVLSKSLKILFWIAQTTKAGDKNGSEVQSFGESAQSIQESRKAAEEYDGGREIVEVDDFHWETRSKFSQRNSILRQSLSDWFLQKTNRLYALIAKISKNKATLDRLIEGSEILSKEQRLDKYMCYVLMTELLFGAKKLPGESKPVQCVLSYKDKFEELLAAKGIVQVDETGRLCSIFIFYSPTSTIPFGLCRAEAPLCPGEYTALLAIRSAWVVPDEWMERNTEHVRELWRVPGSHR